MALNKNELQALYRKRAKRYDLIADYLYPLAGFQVRRYRRETVQALHLRPGDTVVDLGCGTGLNFPWLQSAVGADGKIVGVDLTDPMLEQARQRVHNAGWKNVELIQSDMTQFAFPAAVSGILSTFAITLVPEYDQVIRTAAEALAPAGSMAILDLKRPEGWPDWAVRFAAWLNKPFGVSLELEGRQPWKSIRRHLNEVLFREYYFGTLYLAVGELR